jgi:hypothetical protein
MQNSRISHRGLASRKTSTLGPEDPEVPVMNARAGLLVAAVAAILVVLAPAGAAEAAGGAASTIAELELLTRWMTGTFSSAVQAAENPDYLAVSLHMAAIWPARTDGRWLYVEQAVADYPDQPYRQRVYQLVELVPGLLESRVYTLPDPAAVVGAWRAAEPLAGLDPSDLEERQGCSILLRRRDEAFIGSTLASLCPSELRGASWATSEVVVTADGMVSWDRGFAADGNQVWGATGGGYVFDRIVPDPEPVAEPPAAVE